MKKGVPITEERNKGLEKLIDKIPELTDFYNTYDVYEISEKDKKDFEKYIKGLKDREKELLKSEKLFYVLKFKNKGGVPMPLILNLEYEDGSTEEMKIPVSFWRKGQKELHKMLILDKKLAAVEHDIKDQTLDTNKQNNRFPPRIISKKVKLTKKKNPADNPMKAQNDREKKKADADKEKAPEKK